MYKHFVPVINVFWEAYTHIIYGLSVLKVLVFAVKSCLCLKAFSNKLDYWIKSMDSTVTQAIVWGIIDMLR
jgi:hypothetical protein